MSKFATSARSLCCQCPPEYRLEKGAAMPWGGGFRPYAHPTWHHETCPVAPRPGVHGGMRVFPLRNWQWMPQRSASVGYWKLLEEDGFQTIDHVELSGMARLVCQFMSYAPGFDDLILQSFFLPPTPAVTPDARPSWHHPDDASDVAADAPGSYVTLMGGDS